MAKAEASVEKLVSMIERGEPRLMAARLSEFLALNEATSA